MKKNFLIISIFICLFAFSISAYASDGRSTNYIKLNKSTVTMYITETTTIKATYSNRKLPVRKIVPGIMRIVHGKK